MPGICDPGRDRVVNSKKRYDCFLGDGPDYNTARDKVNTLLITGVSTNSCVLTTTITAQTRDFVCIVVSDCVDTCDEPSFHESALTIIERAFGWVMSAEEALKAVSSENRHSLV
jgi:biuret amidohydrolase